MLKPFPALPMRVRIVASTTFLGLLLLGALSAQNPFKEWPAIEYGGFAIPKDAYQPAEWTRARLRYSDETGYPSRSRFRMNDGSAFPGFWTMDYPRSDRHLLAGVRRLTRIDSRSSEQVVTLDGTDDAFNWPVLYGVEVGHWDLSELEVKQFRQYLLRGGFFMCDDFHGDLEWDSFVRSMSRVFPDRPIVDIKDSDTIFHVLYDLDDKFQVPGAQYFETALTYEKGPSGKTPHWRGIYDDKGRLMVVICHNMDLGDAWEHSDEPRYSEKWASLAYRVAMNYFIYDLTH